MKTCCIFFTIFNLLLFSGCDDEGDDTPTMSTCVLYGDEPVACEAAGCTVMGGARSVFLNGRCVAFVPFRCFPVKSNECSGTDQSYCAFSEDSLDIVYTGNTCHLNLDTNWENCPQGYGMMHIDCYPDPGICSSLSTRETCLEQYCSWVQNATRAVFDGGTCAGWEPEPASFCTGYIRDQSKLIYRESVDGTEIYRLDEVLQVPNSLNFKVSQTPDPWSFCFGDVRFDDPICSSCPEPTK